MAENIDSTTSVESIVGYPDGEELESKQGKQIVTEVVVYDYDDDGQFIGWHKEQA
jgi:hypothetical protein